MFRSLLPPPILVADRGSLEALVRELATCAAVAVDTESNSLHAYRERVCLIQFSTPGADYVVDPLALTDLTPLAPFFANPDQEKIFHAAEYDLLCLARDFRLRFASIFDTMSAARSLGWKQVGLAAILEAHFGVTLNKAHQRADWGRRPLTPDLLDYARLDTHYLEALRERQFVALIESGYWPEAQEDFARLARIGGGAARASADPPVFWRVKGAYDLTPERAAVLQAVFAYRDVQAERMDRPPFKVMSEATLLALARHAPRRLDDLSRLAGMTPLQVQRYGRGVLGAVEEGLRAPGVRPPTPDREPDDVCDRYDRLHTWRKERARARGVESDVIVPRTALWELARRPPSTFGELVEIADLGPWRRDTYGDEILALLAGGERVLRRS